MPPPRRGGGIKRSSASVRLSDVAYIGSNSKTKRPRKTKLCTGVTCYSHTDFKVKSQGHGAGAYCGGHLAAQLVIIIVHLSSSSFITAIWIFNSASNLWHTCIVHNRVMKDNFKKYCKCYFELSFKSRSRSVFRELLCEHVDHWTVQLNRRRSAGITCTLHTCILMRKMILCCASVMVITVILL